MVSRSLELLETLQQNSPDSKAPGVETLKLSNLSYLCRAVRSYAEIPWVLQVLERLHGSDLQVFTLA